MDAYLGKNSFSERLTGRRENRWTSGFLEETCQEAETGLFELLTDFLRSCNFVIQSAIDVRLAGGIPSLRALGFVELFEWHTSKFLSKMKLAARCAGSGSDGLNLFVGPMGRLDT